MAETPETPETSGGHSVPNIPNIYVDADACPVKVEIVRVATRHGLPVHMVSNGGIRPVANPLVELVVVPHGPDAADDWIAARVRDGDICITNDIPLAARCLEAGAQALKPNGETFTPNSIGMAMASRDLMQTLRETGDVTGGPRPFARADRSAFLDRLETAIRAARNRRAPC